MRTLAPLLLCLLTGTLLGCPAAAQGGHGPVFGLATPTLPAGRGTAMRR